MTKKKKNEVEDLLKIIMVLSIALVFFTSFVFVFSISKQVALTGMAVKIMEDQQQMELDRMGESDYDSKEYCSATVVEKDSERSVFLYNCRGEK